MLKQSNQEALPILEAAGELLEELPHAVQEQQEGGRGAGGGRRVRAHAVARVPRVPRLHPLALDQGLQPGEHEDIWSFVWFWLATFNVISIRS